MENTNNYSEFHKKLIKLLEKDVPGWAEKLGVSETNIRTNWFKGSYPGADKLIKLVENGVDVGNLLSVETSNQPAEWIFSQKAKEMYYPCLIKVVSRANEHAERNGSLEGLAKLVINAMKDCLIILEDEDKPKKKKDPISM